MDKKYQVFISSTYMDLLDERKLIIQKLLNANYIPSGMELFNASDEEQFSYIKKVIDICDYYILIIGGRYGSINPLTGISYTEQEYDYAKSKNIPVLAFIYNNPINLPEEKRDANLDKIKSFCEKVKKNRLCIIWDNTNDLIISVINSLNENIAKSPQKGWIRGNIENNTIINFEINRLNDKQKNYEEKIHKLANRLIKLTLDKNKKILTKIFGESIAFDVSKYIKDAIKDLNNTKKEHIQLVLESIYKNALADKPYNGEIIREQCCYFMSFLQISNAYNFLYNVLKNDKSLFVIRGVYIGLLLNKKDKSLMANYLKRLNANPLIASINAGYHQAYYGDKFFNEGYLFNENVNNSGSINALISHLNDESYQILRAIDLFTLRYFIYYNSTSILPVTAADLLDLININTVDSYEGIHEFNELKSILQAIKNYNGVEYYYNDLYIKKLPNENQGLEIYQEYNESVYIDGEFFPHLNKRNYIKEFRERIDKDNLKASNIINIIKEIEVFKNMSQISMLDIGCGYGSIIYYWKKNMLGDAYGIEISECAKEAALHIYEDVKLDIFNINANGDSFKNIIQKYKPKLICCFDFLEHCFNVELFLYNTSNVDKGTYFVIYIPIIDKELMSAEKITNYKYFRRNHIYYFTYKGLISYMNLFGFRYIYDKQIKEYKYLFVFEKS